MDGHVTGTSHSDSQPQLWMTSGRSVLAKSAKMTRRSNWMLCREKFSEKALRASSSQNQICDGVRSEEVDAPKQRGFWDGANLRLGAIDTTNVNDKRGRERERRSEKSQHISNITSILKREYVCMGNAWICDMQYKRYHGLNPIQSYQHIINLHISKCMIILL